MVVVSSGDESLSWAEFVEPISLCLLEVTSCRALIISEQMSAAEIDANMVEVGAFLATKVGPTENPCKDIVIFEANPEKETTQLLMLKTLLMLLQ